MFSEDAPSCPLYGHPYCHMRMDSRVSLTESEMARPQKEDLLRSKIRSSHWYRYIYSLSKYREIYSASQGIRQDT